MTTRFERLRERVLSRATLRALIALTVFVVLWEIGSRSRQRRRLVPDRPRLRHGCGRWASAWV